ncbi:MAG: signal peptide peptidase SppA [Cyclobacteriaceae bacterium]
MAFLRNLLATIVGLFIFCFLFFILLGGIAAAIGGSADSAPYVAPESVLHLDLYGAVTEQSIDDPFQEALGGEVPMSLLDMLSAIEEAKYDDRIRGIYLQPTFVMAGYATLQELRDAIIDFKASGKFVHAYGEYLTEGDYYLASVADSIYLNPEGSLEFNGLSAGVTFFKGLFDKLDIEPEIFRVGEYKSFIEPFIRTSMSEENRRQMSELINSVYDTYLTNVSESRNIPKEDLARISKEMSVRLPKDALEFGLISKVAYEDEIKTLIGEELGSSGSDISFISISKYVKAVKGGNYSSNKVAVIVANGDIVMGEAEGSIGSEQFAKEIRQARESRSVKAIVLRINSPGGSLTASDIIWREIMLTKGKKPIIASMSDVAASGGYFIAMPCDTILAQPNTITGSIGIFGMMFNFGKFMENKLGITNESVSTGDFSDIMTVTRSLNQYERDIIQKGVEAGYETFVTKAAEGRGMEVEELKKYAGGRVWTGTQALERGLVDQLGSFKDAVALAAEKAGISDDYRVSYYPKQKPFLEKLITDISEAKSQIFADELTVISPYMNDIKSLQKMDGIQARLPGNLTIK